MHPIWRRPPPTRLPTRRLELRALGPDDHAALCALVDDNRAHLAPWMDVPDKDELARGLAENADDFASGEVLRYGIWTHGGALIGCTSAAVCARGIELSYWLAAAATGQGLAVEAVAALTALAWSGSLVETLVIRCDPANRASTRVAARLGFRAHDAAVWHLSRAHGTAWSQIWRALAELPGPAIADRGVFRADALELYVLELDGEPHVVATVDLGADYLFDSADLLRHNATLGIGALCARDGRVALRLACHPRAIDGRALRLFHHEAERLRRHGHAPSADTAFAFTHYAD